MAIKYNDEHMMVACLLDEILTNTEIVQKDPRNLKTGEMPTFVIALKDNCYMKIKKEILDTFKLNQHLI